MVPIYYSEATLAISLIAALDLTRKNSRAKAVVYSSRSQKSNVHFWRVLIETFDFGQLYRVKSRSKVKVKSENLSDFPFSHLT